MQVWLRHLGDSEAVQNKYGAIAILFGEVSLMCNDRKSEDAITLYRYRLRRVQQRRFACKKGSKYAKGSQRGWQVRQNKSIKASKLTTNWQFASRASTQEQISTTAMNTWNHVRISDRLLNNLATLVT